MPLVRMTYLTGSWPLCHTFSSVFPVLPINRENIILSLLIHIPVFLQSSSELIADLIDGYLIDE